MHYGLAPLRESQGQFICISFGDETVEARLRLQQCGVERPLGGISRVQVESRTPGLRIWHGRSERSELPTPQTRRNEGCAGALTEAEKKVAPAEIEFAPLRQAQRTVSRRITCKANLTFVMETVKAGGMRVRSLLRRSNLEMSLYIYVVIACRAARCGPPKQQNRRWLRPATYCRRGQPCGQHRWEPF